MDTNIEVVDKAVKKTSKRAHRYFTQSEVETLINGIKNPFHRLICMLVYETGCTEEAGSLKFEDFDVFGKKIKITNYVKGLPTSEYRYVHISKFLASLIWKHKKVCKLSDADFILAYYSGGAPMTATNIQVMLKVYTKDILGEEYLDRATIGSLVYSRVFYLLTKGVALTDICNLLGLNSVWVSHHIVPRLA